MNQWKHAVARDGRVVGNEESLEHQSSLETSAQVGARRHELRKEGGWERPSGAGTASISGGRARWPGLGEALYEAFSVDGA